MALLFTGAGLQELVVLQRLLASNRDINASLVDSCLTYLVAVQLTKRSSKHWHLSVLNAPD